MLAINKRKLQSTQIPTLKMRSHMKKNTAIQIDTVNVVIFAGGKFRENVDETFHVGWFSR